MYPVVKVRPGHLGRVPHGRSVDLPLIPSDPLVGGLLAGRRTRISGSMRGSNVSSPRVSREESGGASGSSSDVGCAGGCAGGDEETRTPDPLLAKEMLCQLSYVPAAWLGYVVGVSGLEPETSALSGQRSNQLS